VSFGHIIRPGEKVLRDAGDLKVSDDAKSLRFPAWRSSWNRLLSSTLRESLVVTVLYAIITLAMTYPLIFVWRSAIPGWAGDGEMFVWSLWWMKYALVNLHSNPGLTTYIFYPSTVNLLSADSTPMNGLLSVALQPLLGVLGSYDALYLFSFIGSGIGTYMLLRYKNCSKSAAFLGGAIFAFAPYRFAHGFGHFGLLTTEWIPFFALYLVRSIREARSLYFVLTPLFFFMTVYSEAYYALHLAMLFVVILLLDWKLVRKKDFIKKLLTVSVPVSLLLGAPLLWLVLDAMVRHSLSNVVQTLGEATWYSADLVGYLIPSVFNPLLGRYVSGITSRFTGNSCEYTTSLGYVTLFFVGYAVARLRKVRDVRVWSLVALIFFLLSLGPILHVMGQTSFTRFNISVPLPYRLLYELFPPIRITRVASRFSIIAMLAASVLVGLALTDFLRRTSLRLRPSRMNMIVATILSLVLIEFAVVPMAVHTVPVSPFYYSLRKETEDFAILDLPQDPRMREAGFEIAYLYMYYQTIHQKKMVGGIIPRAPDSILEFTDCAPVVSDLVYPFNSPDIIKIDASIAQNVLGYYGIRYVILHRNLGLEDRMRRDQILLSRFFDASPVYEDELISVYHAIPPQRFLPFLRLESGWNALEAWPPGIPTRWISGDAGVTIFNPESTIIQLQFSALSLQGPRTVEVYADSRLVCSLQVPENRFQVFQVRLQAMPGCPIAIRFHSREQCRTPKSLLINEDSRCLSIAFRDISVSEVLGAGTLSERNSHTTTEVLIRNRTDVSASSIFTVGSTDASSLMSQARGLQGMGEIRLSLRGSIEARKEI